MSSATTFVSRAPSVLKRVTQEQPRRNAEAVAPARNFQVLQSRSAPAQLSLFLRPSAGDVK